MADNVDYASEDGDIVQGTSGPNTLYGTNEAQSAQYSNLTIKGAGAADTIYGANMLASNAYGNAGDDVLYAGTSSNSSYYGGIGEDILNGDSSVGNTFYGDAGSDVFNAGSSVNATIYGGSGSNTYYGDNATGTITYSGGNDGDTVYAGALEAGSTLNAYGGTGADTFLGNTAQGDVNFSGGDGDDTYYVNSAADVTITDSAGADRIYFDNTPNQYTTSVNGDTLTITSSTAGQTVAAQGVEDFYFSDNNGGYIHYSYEELSTHNFYASSNGEFIQATVESDTIYGSNEGATEQYSNLSLNAGGGADTIYGANMQDSSAYGNAGDDVLYGGTSSNSNYYGGTGNDEFHAASSTNASFYGDGVLDTFHAETSSNAAFYGGAGVSVFHGENATGAVEFYGGNAGNTVNAGEIAEGATLNAYGGTGADTFLGNTAQGDVNFSGGDGDDTYYVNSAADVTITDSAGADRIYFDNTPNQYTTSVNGDTLTITSATVEQTVAAQGVEDFYFSDNNGGYIHYSFEELSTHNFYVSDNGDTIQATIQSDILYGSNEGATEQYSNLSLNAGGGADTIYGANMQDSSAYGNAGDDVLYAGTSSNSRYYGGAGNDEFHAASSTEANFYGDGVLDTFHAENSSNAAFYGGAGVSVFHGENATGSVEFYGGNAGNTVNAGEIAKGATLNAYGGNGADTFHGDSAQGMLNFYGGDGADTYYADTAVNVTVTDSTGSDTLYLSLGEGHYTFEFSVETHTVTLSAEIDGQYVYVQGVEVFYFSDGNGGWVHYTYDELSTHEFYASASNETITGTSDPDFIYGSNQGMTEQYTGLTLYGEGDNDTINGANMGTSTAYGGAGDDYITGESSYQSVFYGGEGNDQIHGGESVDNTFYGDNGLDEIYADNAEDATFYGGNGSNIFNADTAVGSVTYYGGDTGDIINAGQIGSNTTLSAYGGTSSDVFHAQAAQGAVNFHGGAGSDTYYAESAGNVSITDSSGTDSLYLDHSYSQYNIQLASETKAADFLDNGANQNVYTQGIEDFYFKNGDGGWDHYTYEELACFLAGTLIRTPQGEVAVETLKAGDLVLTTTGEAKPVLWLGRRAVATRFAHPLTALPIHIRPDALGRGLPARDLFVSPDHAFFMGGLLVQAGALVNGVTITRHHNLPEIFTYYHVELEDHDLIYAEGLPAETFIDNLERETFDNAADFPGRTRPAVELDLPRVKSRRQLPKVLARALGERAARAVPRVA